MAAKGKRKNAFSLKIFCSNCYSACTLWIKYGKEVFEDGTGQNMLATEDGNLNCPKCGSLKLNKIRRN